MQYNCKSISRRCFIMTEEQAIQRMWEDIRFRNLSNSTYKNYTRNIRNFFAFCRKPIEELDENDIRNFLHYLIDEKKYAPTTVNQSSAAIRFFFAVSLNRCSDAGRSQQPDSCLYQHQTSSVAPACVRLWASIRRNRNAAGQGY